MPIDEPELLPMTWEYHKYTNQSYLHTKGITHTNKELSRVESSRVKTSNKCADRQVVDSRPSFLSYFGCSPNTFDISHWTRHCVVNPPCNALGSGVPFMSTC